MADSPPSEPLALLEPGAIVAGRYRVEVTRPGGRSAEARDLGRGEHVDLRLLGPGETAALLEHAHAAMAIASESVARVIDAGALPTGEPYLVSERPDGLELAELLDRAGPLPIADAARLTLEGAQGVAAAHEHGVVHGSLALGKLIVARRTDGSPIVKVLGLGEPPPGAEKAGDVRALAAILFELCAGRAPHAAPDPLLAVRPDAPEALSALLDLALGDDASARPASAHDLEAALAPFASSPEPMHRHRGHGFGESHHQIVLAPYTAPHSRRAARTFAEGRSTYPGPTLAGKRVSKDPPRGTLVIVLVALLTLIGLASVGAAIRAKLLNRQPAAIPREPAPPAPSAPPAPPPASSDQ